MLGRDFGETVCDRCHNSATNTFSKSGFPPLCHSAARFGVLLPCIPERTELSFHPAYLSGRLPKIKIVQ